MNQPTERATTEPRKAQPGSYTNRRTTPDRYNVVSGTGRTDHSAREHYLAGMVDRMLQIQAEYEADEQADH